jgi:hypothetical protein
MDPVEIVVAVPLEPFGRDAGIVNHAVDQLRDAAGQRRPGSREPESECIAEGYPHLQVIGEPFGQGHELLDKGQNKSIRVSPRDILEIAQGANARADCILDHPHVRIAVLISLLKAMPLHHIDEIAAREAAVALPVFAGDAPALPASKTIEAEKVMALADRLSGRTWKAVKAELQRLCA